MGVSFSKTETVESLEGVSGCQLFRVAPKYTVKVPPYPAPLAFAVRLLSHHSAYLPGCPVL